MLHMVIASTLAAFPYWGGVPDNTKKPAQEPERVQKQEKVEKVKHEEEQPIYELHKPCASTHVNTCSPTNWAFQVRGAAFIPLRSQLRDIYGSGLPTLEFEGSYSFLKDTWTSCDQLLVWGNIGWTSQNGRAHGFHSKLNLVPLSAGIEYQVHFGRYFDFYVGIGPTLSFLRIKNKRRGETNHFNRDQAGFTTKTGLRATFPTNFFIDVFTDYYYTQFRKMHKDSISIDNHFSAFIIGAGFGYKW